MIAPFGIIEMRRPATPARKRDIYNTMMANWNPFFAGEGERPLSKMIDFAAGRC